jgi:arylsulfatase A-like enzyme
MNVIVILADSLRADHLGCYGNPWIKTPCLDALAREAVRFDRYYTEGLPTLPTRQTLLTGRFTLPFRGWQSPEPRDPWLPEHLWSRGYTSALVTDVYHMHAPGRTFGRGFDTVEFIRGQEYDDWQVAPDESVDADARHRYRGDAQDAEVWRPRFTQYLKNTVVRRGEETFFAPQVVNAAIAWLERQAVRDRLFLWVDLFDPHEPWDPPEPFYSLYDGDYQGQELIDPIPGPVDGYMTPREVQHTAALYAGEVGFVDKWVGVLLAALQRLGMWDDTLVIFTTDHGELLGERGVIRKARPWSYEEMSRIPLLVRLPGGEAAGTVADGFAQTPDLLPTICSVLGIEPPAGTHGLDLLPLARGEVGAVRPYAVSGWHQQTWSIRDETWSLHLWLPGYIEQPWDPRQAGTRELYRLPDDPGESRNLAARHPDVADRLELELRRFIAGLRWE